MPGSSNFNDWNPTNANQESDAAYTADAQRSGGAVSGPFPAATANKVLRQTSVFPAALADSMAAKGYVLSDASRATLAGVLAAIVTSADAVKSSAVGVLKLGPLFGNIIIQWGIAGPFTAGTRTVNFPSSFTSVQPVIVLTPLGTTSTVVNYVVSDDSTGTHFDITFSGSGIGAGIDFFWFAIGT